MSSHSSRSGRSKSASPSNEGQGGTSDGKRSPEHASGSTKRNDKPQMQADAIQRVMGSFGVYHLRLCLVVFITKFFIAFHQMAILFLAPKISYTCPDTEKQTCPCDNPVYDKSIFSRTIIMEWDLICNRKYLTSLTQTLFQLGVLIGSVLFGMASDRFGRRKPLLLAVIVQTVMGIAAAFIPEYWTFSFFRFIIGLTVGGTMVCSFVICMEFVGSQYRDTVSALYQVPFNLGHLLLPILAYFIRDFSHLQLAISVPAVLMLSYFVLVPETPRWLLAVNKTDKAIKILEHVAKVNKRPVENIKSEVEAYQAARLKNTLKKGSLWDLFRTSNLRKHIILMALNWLACSYCFYGVAQFVGQLSGNAFINVATSATTCLLGSLASIPIMKVIGRRTIVIVFHFICAGCLLILAVIPEGIGSVILASVGTVSSFIVFVVVYLYCGELFPTVVRNAAIGFCSMTARVGSMVAPFVIDMGGVAKWLPPLIFAVVPLIAGFLTFMLPETKGCDLMTTLEEGENFGKKSKK